MTFDIAQIHDVASASIDIKHPTTGESIGAQIEVAGPEHPQRKAIEFARQRKIRAGLQKTGKIELSDPADDELDAIEMLTSCTLGWKGITEGGVEVPFSRDAAYKLYSTEGLAWLRIQVLNAMGERDRFIKASAND